MCSISQATPRRVECCIRMHLAPDRFSIKVLIRLRQLDIFTLRELAFEGTIDRDVVSEDSNTMGVTSIGQPAVPCTENFS